MSSVNRALGILSEFFTELLLKALLMQAGLPRSFCFHDLRHTWATLLLRQGVNPKFVQELLGHADISLTLNIYSHVLPDMGDAAAGAMDAALG
jgi:integrase